MTFLKITSYYPDFVRFAASKAPHLDSLSYDQQMDYLFSFGFGWADFWKKHIEENKNIPVIEIIYNVDIVQKKWAEEHSIIYSKENWQNEILEAQISFYQPEVIFFEDHLKVPREYKKKFPFIKFIACWDGLALKDPARFEGADLIASCHVGTVEFYRKKNINSFLFLFGFENSILDKIIQRQSLHDVSFVGSINLYKNGHRQRLNLLYELSKNIEPSYWITGAQYVPPLSLKALKYAVKGMAGEMLKLNKVLKHNKGKAFGLDMYQILSDSKITINTHIDAAGQYAANIRLFESTGVGTCLLTDWKQNLHELFEIDKEVVAYKSIEECIEKTKWLLDHESERKKIAEAGQKKTHERYLLKNRILEFFSQITY